MTIIKSQLKMSQIIYSMNSLKFNSSFEEEIDQLCEKGKNGFTQEFYIEFCSIKDKIILWLKKEYPLETSDRNIFRDDGSNIAGPYTMDYNNPQNYGIDAFITCQTRPAPHYGFPGAQWGYDNSIPGIIAKMVPALVQAYQKCKQAHEQNILAQKQREKELAMRDEYSKYRDLIVRINQDYKRSLNASSHHYISKKEEDQIIEKIKYYKTLLIKSLHMKWKKARILNRVLHPAHWAVVFSSSLLIKCRKELGYYGSCFLGIILDDAWQESKEIRKQIKDAHFRQLEAQKWQEEEKKANILSKAIVKALEEKNNK